ncbi:MAG: aldehyde ferredoxin oxidoreductase [Chloroflexota bacterium]|nr:MAG: aldehyde ferredoxin oxidoreductase [Chloroflexota bacterium]
MTGYMSKYLWVDLTKGTIKVETFDPTMAREYVGGYGLGARILYDRMKPGVDPLGPDNVLGFLTGPLTGSPSIEGNRSVIVCKSPLTGGWGDANCGGTFGAHFRFTGHDAVFFVGKAARPTYLWVENDHVELRDASDLWGQDANEAEHALQARHGRGTEVAVIGQSGENLSLIACVMNDEGRAWGRSGVGAVMGSKNLKAIAIKGTKKVEVADLPKAEGLRRSYMKKHTGAYPVFVDFGTTGITGDSSWSGDSPVKNWFGAATTDFPQGKTSFDKDTLKAAYQDKKYGCWKCTMACGGHMSVKSDNGGKDAQYVGVKHHKAEYETACAFGTMMLNDNYASTILANELCNRYGLDTISAAGAISFAMDCYSRGILTKADLDGVDLTWGNHEAIIAMLHKIGKREGFGDTLADGVKRAAERIGRGSEACAIHVGGQELPMHDPRFVPGLATTYQLDATPGRHTQGGELNPWPDMTDVPDKFDYGGKGEYVKKLVCAVHFVNSVGVCLFGYLSYPIETWPAFLSAVTGEAWTLEKMLEAGERVANIRHAFNLREGINPLEIRIPQVVVGNPPLTEGNNRGVTIDTQAQNLDYLNRMHWDAQSARPDAKRLGELNMGFLARDLAAARA